VPGKLSDALLQTSACEHQGDKILKMNELVYSTFATQTNEIIRICPVSSSLTFMEDEAKKVIDFPKFFFLFR